MRRSRGGADLLLAGATAPVRTRALTGGQVLQRALKIVLAFLAGLAVGEALPIAWYILATNYFGLFDRDGGGAMGAIFIAGPVLAVLVGTMAAIVTAKRTA